jgi:hypothetical protein
VDRGTFLRLALVTGGVAARTDDPTLSCLFHAWEGGSGFSDCMDASRAFGPAGETWSVVATYRL